MSKRLDYDHVAPAGMKALGGVTIAISLMNAYNRMAISFRNTPKAAIEMVA